MSKVKYKQFQRALESNLGKGFELITHIAYYTPDLEGTIIDQYGPMASIGWRKFRRTERIQVYPGGTTQTVVFYVAHHHEYMPDFDTELVEPLGEPNYISMLDLLPGQIAHLGVDLSDHEMEGESDEHILKLMGLREGSQLIQKGEVRVGRKYEQKYSIYNTDGFLPIKISR